MRKLCFALLAVSLLIGGCTSTSSLGCNSHPKYETINGKRLPVPDIGCGIGIG